MLQLIYSLWKQLSAAQKNLFKRIVLLTLVSSFFEVLSIGMVLPFILSVTSPSWLNAYDSFTPSFVDNNLLVYSSIMFVLFTVVAGGIRLYHLKRVNQVAFKIGAELSSQAFGKTLSKKYEFYLNNNSSDLVSGLQIKTNILILNIIVPLVVAFSSGIMVVSIILFVLVLSPALTLSTFLFFVFIYYFYSRLVRSSLQLNATVISDSSNNLVKIIQESLSQIKNIIISGNILYFYKSYLNLEIKQRHAQASNIFVSQSPRIVMEVVGIIGLVAIAAVSINVGLFDTDSVLAFLGVLTLSIQRTLPLVQRIYLGWSSVAGAKSSLEDILNLLNSSNEDRINLLPKETIAFQHNIEVQNVTFSYKNVTKKVLSNITVTIPKGSIVGIMGQSGSGKSTFVSILCGLLAPSDGKVRVDGQVICEENVAAWWQLISYVPQNAVLVDASVLDNIYLGQSDKKGDYARAMMCAKIACIEEMVVDNEPRHPTTVGERGARLSGGQIQRICIAQALYRNASIIILDEATGGIDIQTEARILKNIKLHYPNVTVVLVTHRVNPLIKYDLDLSF